MSNRIVECVPNISEGRDHKKIDAVVQAAADVAGVDVLDVDPGAETNRTVITLVGAPGVIEEAAFRLIQRSSELIDMSKQSGAHSRHGATDVCPFVPVANVTMDDCIAIARALGERVGNELELPVYIYDQAALKPERRSLAHVRQGEYEALEKKLKQAEWAPDFGPAKFVPTFGAVNIGAREFLIAYNVNLNTRSKDQASDIAWELREKGRAVRREQTTGYYSSGKLVKYRPSEGIFPDAYSDFVASSLDELAAHYKSAHGLDLAEEFAFFGRDPEQLEGVNVMRRGKFQECRAVGWMIPEYGRAQISINLTNFRVTNTHDVLEESRRLATERGIIVTGSEVVGVVPFEAMLETGRAYLEQQGSSRGVPVRDIMETGVQSLGLRELGEFDIDKSVLGLPRTDGELASMPVNDLADEVSRATPAPGGGSIAALAGALGASLGAMVANLTHTKKKYTNVHERAEGIAERCQSLKDDLLRAIDADTDAFNGVIDAMRLPKGTDAEAKARDAAIEAGYKHATQVPLETAKLSLEAIRLCREMAEIGLASSVTDAGVGAWMARAGLEGAIYNVRINFQSIQDREWVGEIDRELDAMLAEGAEVLAATDATVKKSF